jgi:hypothetical protein
VIHKGLALLLVLSWMILSEQVLIQHFDVSGSKFQTHTGVPTWIAKSDATLTDDPTESAGKPPLSHSKPLRTATVTLTTFAPTSLHACFKLHKLHHVFLI